MNQIDLHMHTEYSSDGTYSPEELVRMCHDAGLKVIAIPRMSVQRPLYRNR